MTAAVAALAIGAAADDTARRAGADVFANDLPVGAHDRTDLQADAATAVPRVETRAREFTGRADRIAAAEEGRQNDERAEAESCSRGSKVISIGGSDHASDCSIAMSAISQKPRRFVSLPASFTRYVKIPETRAVTPFGNFVVSVR